MNTHLNTNYKILHYVKPPTIQVTKKIKIQQMSGPSNEIILC